MPIKILTKAQIHEIHRLRDDGISRHDIEKLTGLDRRIVYRHYYNKEFNGWLAWFAKEWNAARAALVPHPVKEYGCTWYKQFELDWKEMQKLYGKR